MSLKVCRQSQVVLAHIVWEPAAPRIYPIIHKDELAMHSYTGEDIGKGGGCYHMDMAIVQIMHNGILVLIRLRGQEVPHAWKAHFGGKLFIFS